MWLTAIVVLLPFAAAAGDVTTSHDTVSQNEGFLQKLDGFSQRAIRRVAEIQSPSATKKPRIVFTMPPVGSTPDYGWGIGAGASLVFKTDYSRPLLYTSSIPLTVRFGLTDPFSYTIACNPVIYFNDNRLRVSARLSYRQANEYYYGIGYSTNKELYHSRLITGYQSQRWQAIPEVQWRIDKSPVYLGILADFSFDSMGKIGQYVASEAHYVNSGGKLDGFDLTDIGLGANFTYDTRDDAKGPQDGMVVDLKGTLYSRCIGSDNTYGKVTFDYRQYMRLGGLRSVLSWGVSSSNVIGDDVPWARYSTIGDIYQMRGYYSYQYRDRSVLKTHVEYRYMFDFRNEWGQLILNRFGVACFAGAALIGHNPIKYEGFLPEIGAGLRLKITYRMNFHLDYGYDARHHVLRRYFGIAEIF